MPLMWSGSMFMNNNDKNNSISGAEGPCHDLAPEGGTPFRKWLSCCLPSSPAQQQHRVSPSTITRTAPVGKIQVTKVPVVTFQVEDDDASTISTVQAAENDNNNAHLIKPPSTTTLQVKPSLMAEFVRLFMAILFLRFLTNRSPSRPTLTTSESSLPPSESERARTNT
jgi:hypothetical protein